MTPSTSSIALAFVALAALAATSHSLSGQSPTSPGSAAQRPVTFKDLVGSRNPIEFYPGLTRIGLKIDGGEYDGMKVPGKIESDFANFPGGVLQSRPTPRIRLACIDLDNPTWDFRIGQDWDTISPLYPAVNHKLVMWNAGNLGDRSGQVRATYSNGELAWKSPLGLTGAINNQDPDGTTNSKFVERDGFDSGPPDLQSRVSFAQGAPSSACAGQG